MLKHKVTPRTESLGRALRTMSAEIEPGLHLVSQAARDEWESLQRVWPSDIQLREGTIALTEIELGTIEAKVRRFRDIVRSLAPRENVGLRLILPWR